MRNANVTKGGQNALLARLKRLEGQVRGLHQMVAEGRECEEIAYQFSAASVALKRAAFVFFVSHMQQCLAGKEHSPNDLEKLAELFVRFG